MMVIVGTVLGIALLTVIYIAACWAPERKFEGTFKFTGGAGAGA